jgi:hypothetical protein
MLIYFHYHASSYNNSLLFFLGSNISTQHDLQHNSNNYVNSSRDRQRPNPPSSRPRRSCHSPDALSQDRLSLTLDMEKLGTLPLLQSILTETLRLHMNFNLIRNVNEPITINGFTLQKGAMLQAPMLVANYD